MTDAEGNQYAYEYELGGRVAKIVKPSGAIVEYSYDANGNML